MISPRNRSWVPLITATLLWLLLGGVVAQDAPVPQGPTYVGPQPCPIDSSIEGYTDTDTLFQDSIALAIEYADGNGKDEYRFSFCPDTVFDFGEDLDDEEAQAMTPVIPVLHNSIYFCGEYGNPLDNCVFKGGHIQVQFEDEFLVDNVNFIGVTFENSGLMSVAAHAHPASAVFFQDCIWRDHSSLYLVSLFWHEELDFGIELPPDGQRRLNELINKDQKKKIKEKLSRTSKRSWNPDLHNNRQLDESRPSMYAAFHNCYFMHNELRIVGISNIGGRVELVASTFEFNRAYAIIANTNEARFATYSGTKFLHNQDLLGPVFVDKSSEIVLNDDTDGLWNAGLVSLGIPGNDCNGIFIEKPGEECFPIEIPGELCEGFCCAFGDSVCATNWLGPQGMDENPDFDPSYASLEVVGKSSEDQSGGEPMNDKSGGAVLGNFAPSLDPPSRGCDTTCVIIATVVPIGTIIIILLGVGLYMGGRNKTPQHEVATVAESEAPAMNPVPGFS